MGDTQVSAASVRRFNLIYFSALIVPTFWAAAAPAIFSIF
jgi:hypothetical protein